MSAAPAGFITVGSPPWLMAIVGTVLAGGLAVGLGVWVRGGDLERRRRLRAAGERATLSSHTTAGRPARIATSPWLAGIPDSWIASPPHGIALRVAEVAGGSFVRETVTRLHDEPMGDVYLRESVNLAARLTAMPVVAGVVLGAALALTERVSMAWLLLLALGLMSILGSRIPSILANRWFGRRAAVAVRELPVLIDTISLCTRAGMSFDQALELYCSRFNGLLAALLGDCLEMWRSGLTTRARELERVAARLGSPLVETFFSAVVQSIDLGTPLAATLDAQAAEVRAQRKSQVEERIAKLPVKMLIPIGLFTLPAMLLLLLAPIGLQVVAGMG